MDDGLGVVAGERDRAAHRQDTAIAVTPPNAYCNASLLAPEYVPVLGSPSVMVADPPGMQTADYMVREVEVGPGITLGFLSFVDYKFITSLFVIAEEHLERNRQGV